MKASLLLHFQILSAIAISDCPNKERSQSLLDNSLRKRKSFGRKKRKREKEFLREERRF
jgi:hypothetical protein